MTRTDSKIRSHYEEIQDFNFVTRFLHKTRYKNLINLVNKIESKSDKAIRILDIGCGSCKAYNVINKNIKDFDYTGIEISEEYCHVAEARYSKHTNFHLINSPINECLDIIRDYDLIIGLESFEHIPEGQVVRVIESIAKSNFKYLYITVPNEVGPALLIKNTGSFLMGYSRHKEYTFKETLHAGAYNLDKVSRHTTLHKGFDWRWLAQTLRQNVIIEDKLTSPFSFIPKFISPSIGFVCRRG